MNRKQLGRSQRPRDANPSRPGNNSSLFGRVLDNLKKENVPCVPEEESGRIRVEVQYFPEENTTLRDPDGNAIVHAALAVDEAAETVSIQVCMPWGIRTGSEREMVQSLLGDALRGCGLDIAYQDAPEGTVVMRATTSDPKLVFRRLFDMLLVAYYADPIVRHVMQNDAQAAARAYTALGLSDDMPDKQWMLHRRKELGDRLKVIAFGRVCRLKALIDDAIQKHAEAVNRSTRNAGARDVFFYVPLAFVVLVDRTIVGRDMTISELRSQELLEKLNHTLSTSCRNCIVRAHAKEFLADDNAGGGDG